jgi:lipoprotein-releasing system permease protein
MTIHSWIAGRYFHLRRASRFLPLLSTVSIGGVAIGIMALVVVLSVMRGFSSELEHKLMGFNAHVTITRSSEAKSFTSDEITALTSKNVIRDVSPFVMGEAIAQTKVLEELVAAGVKVYGMDPDHMGFLSTVDFYFPEGSDKMAGLTANYASSSLPGIILGNELLTQLTVHPDFEDRIELVAPLADIGPTGEMEPRMRNYKLIGSFRSGVFEYDSKYVFVSLAEARRLLGAQAQDGFRILLTDPSAAPAIAANLRQRLGDSWKVESWDIQNKKLFAALKLERLAMSGILLLIILIASFSIVGVLMMVVSSKRKDIAILRSMGMNARSIRKIFLMYGMRIGTVGSLLGGLLGSALCLALTRWPIRLPASYYLDILPVSWSLVATIIFITSGIVIAMIASLYPISQATSEDPVAILRYE